MANNLKCGAFVRQHWRKNKSVVLIAQNERFCIPFISAEAFPKGW
jgi:hypothetical protein